MHEICKSYASYLVKSPTKKEERQESGIQSVYQIWFQVAHDFRFVVPHYVCECLFKKKSSTISTMTMRASETNIT